MPVNYPSTQPVTGMLETEIGHAYTGISKH
jgi:hypothetical protein